MTPDGAFDNDVPALDLTSDVSPVRLPCLSWQPVRMVAISAPWGRLFHVFFLLASALRLHLNTSFFFFYSHCGSDVRPAEAYTLINVRPFLYTCYSSETSKTLPQDCSPGCLGPFKSLLV